MSATAGCCHSEPAASVVASVRREVELLTFQDDHRVLIDRAEDLRRRLLEEDATLRWVARRAGVSWPSVESALVSIRAAAHVLDTISSALAEETDQNAAGPVIQMAARFMMSAEQMMTQETTRSWGRAGGGVAASSW